MMKSSNQHILNIIVKTIINSSMIYGISFIIGKNIGVYDFYRLHNIAIQENKKIKNIQAGLITYINKLYIEDQNKYEDSATKDG
jgi:hypothetical protein